MNHETAIYEIILDLVICFAMAFVYYQLWRCDRKFKPEHCTLFVLYSCVIGMHLVELGNCLTHYV